MIPYPEPSFAADLVGMSRSDWRKRAGNVFQSEIKTVFLDFTCEKGLRILALYAIIHELNYVRMDADLTNRRITLYDEVPFHGKHEEKENFQRYSAQR